MMTQGEFFTAMTDENVSNELIDVIEFLQGLNKDENAEEKLDDSC